MTGREPISVRTRFERFPATVKGAFIIRGEDPDPHQVTLRGSRIVSVDGRTTRPLSMGAGTLDVAPHRDVFVPFEVAVSDLDPGWYGFSCDVDVDGVPVSYPGDRRFLVAWPRAKVRRGRIDVARELRLGPATVRIEQLECGGDSTKLHLSVDPPTRIAVKLRADEDRLEVLGLETDETSGRVKVTAYPLLRSHGSLTIGLKGRGVSASATVSLP